jgi:diphthamide synthase (EF-2-diphthine--ammonia ligase)
VKLEKQFGLSPSGEGGEIETTVLDAPMFQKKIEVVDFEVRAEENVGIFVINEARLMKK